MQVLSHNAATLPRERPAHAARHMLGLFTLLLLWTATWALSHGYKGVYHDARLYTLQALAHLQPGSLSKDVFLRFGSQDQYTIFSPFYAAAIQWLGIEPAAAVLTLTLQLALFLSAALLVRKVVPFPFTLLGVSVLIAIPGMYGAGTVFSCVEPFLTPRMGAEALVLCALAAALTSRPRLAFGILGAAMLVHPVMSAAGVAALLFLYVGLPRPRLAALLIGSGVLLLIAASFVLPSGRFGAFDLEWLALVKQRSPYAFLANWTLDDWGCGAVSLATLAVGSRVLVAQPARNLCQIALLTALGGLALTLIACDWLHLVIFTQLQPWRWQWLAVVAAALLLPAIAAAGWQSTSAGKTTTVLLAAAWLFASNTFALVTSLAAVASLVLTRWPMRNEVRLILYGSVGLLVIAVAARIASNLLFLDTYYYDPQIPLWIRKMASFAYDGSAPFALILLAGWLARRERGTPALLLLAMISAGACIALFPDAWRRWSQQQFPPSLVAQFAPWRALIPPGTDVFWSESALATWVLLERPSYLSVIQTSGMIFSRSSALELQRRARALGPVVPAEAYLRLSGGGAGIGPSAEQLERACAIPEFEFLVTGARLSWQPVAQVPRTVWHSSGGLRLYRCSDRAG